LDRSEGATTFTFSSTAPVACTATVDIGLWPVDPLNGTMVTSASNCPLVSTVVVLARADAGLFVAGPPVVATTAATTPPTKTTPTAEVMTMTRMVGRRRFDKGASACAVSSLTVLGA
jgi:hypothetical protein